MTTNKPLAKRSKKILSLFGFSLVILTLLVGSWACESKEAAQDSGPAEETGEAKEFTLLAKMDGYVGVGGDIDGEKNPTLAVSAGDEVVIHLINGENMSHDIAFRGHDISSEMIVRVDEETTFEFIAQSDDTYYCTVPGHEQAGMVGEIKVQGSDNAPGQPRAQN